MAAAKYAPTRVRKLVIGGAQPYPRQSSPLSASDPKAFVETVVRSLGLDFATLSSEKQAEFLDNDFEALAAARGDRPDLEHVLPTMRMPCFLYGGEVDGTTAEAQRCAKDIANCTFMSFPNLTHPEAFYRGDLVLPHVMRFLQS
jgi:pimeloyl-ACP methyl ester carboxylesterase